MQALLAWGLTTPEIAKLLSASSRTIRRAKKRIRAACRPFVEIMKGECPQSGQHYVHKADTVSQSGHDSVHIADKMQRKRVGTPLANSDLLLPDLLPDSSFTTRVKRGDRSGKGGVNLDAPTQTNIGSLKLPAITFDWTDGVFGGISDGLVQRWEQTYPACDVDAEIAKAAEWLLANPKQRKKNYRRFLTNWLSRTQDKGGTRRQR